MAMTPDATSATEPQPASDQALPARRQLVGFAFFRLDPAFRRLPASDRAHAREEFAALFAKPQEGLLCLSYSTVGLKADTDFLLWRIGEDIDVFQRQQQAINQTRLGAYLTMSRSFLSMTKRSIYVAANDPVHAAPSRARLVPGQRKYLFVYPFVKTRQWYLLPKSERQRIMDEHIRGGGRYPSVKLNTTYSFGLDDQDFVVAFETDEPADFLDLVMELRETRSSEFTQRDTPMYTCVQMPVDKILEQLF